MADTSDSNPFAAPQSASSTPVAAAEAHPEAEILQIIHSELAKTKFGFWAVALACSGIAGFNLWHIFAATAPDFILINYIAAASYAVAGVLTWRIISKLSKFSRKATPWAMNDVFSAHAAFWKFLGIEAILGVVLVISGMLLSVLFRR
jgi:hypothetical protein